MRKHLALAVSILVLAIHALFPSSAASQSRSPWLMNPGEGIVGFGFMTPYHGFEGEYDFATIPAPGDPGWGPAPDPDTIGYAQVPSTLCGVMDCRWGADFTYFQTFVNVPSNVVVTEFKITFTGVDDGVRVSIFNSDHPGGAVVPGSYVFLGGTGTADLAALVKSGEVNRVVVTHTDDCCFHSYLTSARVVLNGEVVEVNRPPLCVAATASPSELWAPNHKLVPIEIVGVTDPDGDPITITVTGVTQDEPVNDLGDGNTCPDAVIVEGQASVRAERSGHGNDRVYVLSFIATDDEGASCSGAVTVCVPHDQGEESPVGPSPFARRMYECLDDGQTYNSLGPCLRHGPKPGAAGPVASLRIAAPVARGSRATLEFSLPADARVELAVYDMLGRRAATIEDSYRSAGTHQVSWDASGLPAGMYFYRLRAGGVYVSSPVLILQ